MKRTLRRILAGVLSAALVIPMCSTGTSGSTAEAAEVLQPVYQWNFETYGRGDGGKCRNGVSGQCTVKGNSKSRSSGGRDGWEKIFL